MNYAFFLEALCPKLWKHKLRISSEPEFGLLNLKRTKVMKERSQALLPRSRQSSSFSTPVRPPAAGVGSSVPSSIRHLLLLVPHRVLLCSGFGVFDSVFGPPIPRSFGGLLISPSCLPASTTFEYLDLCLVDMVGLHRASGLQLR